MLQSTVQQFNHNYYLTFKSCSSDYLPESKDHGCSTGAVVSLGIFLRSPLVTIHFSDAGSTKSPSGNAAVGRSFLGDASGFNIVPKRKHLWLPGGSRLGI